MFTPSLVSMMWHSFPRTSEPDDLLPVVYPNVEGLAKAMERRLFQAGPRDWPSLPVIARMGSFDREMFWAWFAKDVVLGETAGGLFFWGRIPLDRLVNYFRLQHGLPAESEYFDIGTPIKTSGSGSTADDTCRQLLEFSGIQPSIGVAIVDMGTVVTGRSPDDYGGKLHHAVTYDVEMSDHAEAVLSALVERLNANNTLSSSKVACSLVKAPGKSITSGLSCFNEPTSVEVLNAVKALTSQLDGDNLPAVVNLSLGTHVGPHNGDSPFEEYLANTLTRACERFAIASAGNDGTKDLAASRELEAGLWDYLLLHTEPTCAELLVEFWWEDLPGVDLSISVRIEEPVPGIGNKLHGRLMINGGAGATLATRSVGLPSTMQTLTLFEAHCRNNLSCIAFAMTAPATLSLPRLEIVFELRAQQDVVVKSWVVVPGGRSGARFANANSQGSINVPASDPALLSVAGVRPSGQMWRDSSRGPAAQYSSAAPLQSSPLMAHRADLRGDWGTSFASPRACADAAMVMNDPSKRPAFTDVTYLLTEMYSLYPLPPWNDRYGYHRQTI